MRNAYNMLEQMNDVGIFWCSILLLKLWTVNNCVMLITCSEQMNDVGIFWCSILLLKLWTVNNCVMLITCSNKWMMLVSFGVAFFC